MGKKVKGPRLQELISRWELALLEGGARDPAWLGDLNDFNRFKSALNSLDKANSTMSLSLFPSAMSDADLNLNLERGTRKVGDQEEEANRRTGVQTATVGRREKTLNKQSRKGILDKP